MGGGLSIPPAIGGKPPMMGKKPPTANGLDPDSDDDIDTAPTIEPQMVNYHEEAHSCQTCANFDSGQCSVLKMQVSPEGGCTAYSAGGGQSDDEGQQDDGQQDMGSSDADTY